MQVLSAFLITLFTLPLALSAQHLSSANWLTDMDQAQQVSITDDRPILMVFSGSDWCKPCIRMRKTIWESEAFVQYANDHLILLEVDFPASKKHALSISQTKHNEQLAEQYNPEGAFPAVVLLNKAGEELLRFGFNASLSPEDYIQSLQQVIAQNF